MEGADSLRVGDAVVYQAKVHYSDVLVEDVRFVDHGGHRSAEVLEYFHPKRVS